MSVLINMEMPKGCASCKISRRNGKKMICPFIWKCEWDIHDPMAADHRLDGCPLVPVPPHGRLIDADALMGVIRAHDYPLRAHFNSTDNGMFTIGIQQAVDEAPTIIPADKEETE